MPAARPFLPFALPEIGDEEIAEVVDTLRSGWLTTGPKAKRFEDDFSAFLGDPALQSLAVNSATAGLHLALEALGIGPGDEVITTTHTFTATAEVVRYLGADVRLVDIDPETLCIDPSAVEAAVAAEDAGRSSRCTTAACAADMAAILDIARRHGLGVVEDAAHALPATCGGKLVGTLGSDATVFSFYANKTITTGEGGMVVSRDEELVKRDEDDAPARHEPRRVRPLHGEGAELVLRDRGAGLQVQPDRHRRGDRHPSAAPRRRVPAAPAGDRRGATRAGLAGLPLHLPAAAGGRTTSTPGTSTRSA